MFPIWSFSSKLRKNLCLGLALPLLLLLLSGVRCGPAMAREALGATTLSPETSGSSPRYFCQVGETLFFRASDGYHGTELWKMDGPGATPVMVADLNPTGNSSPSDLTRMEDRLFFFADDGTNGLQLWISDGTKEGTAPLTKIPDGFSRQFNPTMAGERLFFFAKEKEHGFQFWTSDGTETGTFPVTQLDPPGMFGSTFNGELCTVGNKAYFTAYDETHGYELWVSDGSMAGTGLVCDLAEGAESSLPIELTESGSSLVFLRLEPGREQVYRLPEGSSDPLPVTSFDHFDNGGLYSDSDDNLIIFVRREDKSVDIWELKPSAASADFLDTLTVASADFIHIDTPLGRLNGDCVFPVRSFSLNPETGDRVVTSVLWGLGGEGTYPIASLGNEVAEAGQATILGEAAYFVTSEAQTGRGRLWKTDGTAGGTMALTETGEGLSVRNIQAFGGSLFLEANEPHHGTELWTSDGTAEGTRLHTDINRKTTGESLVWNDRLFTGGWDDSGPGLWTSDGTAEGTSRVAWTPPVSGFSPRYFFDGEDRFYFIAGGNLGDVRLWTSDGTMEGTAELTDLGPDTHDSYQEALQELDGKHYFIRHTGEEEYMGTSPELWTTDGTPEGTLLIAELDEDDCCSSRCLIRNGDRLVFETFNHDTQQAQLWTSDGSAEGTAPLSETLEESLIYKIAAIGSGDICFLLYNASDDLTLWKSDGTDEGTVQIALIGTERSALADDLTPCEDRVFFRVQHSATGETSLWVTEMTAETTKRVAIINPDGNDSIGSLTALGNRVFFAAEDGTHGREIWTSDGTEEGTFLVADLSPGGSSNPTDLTVLGTSSALTNSSTGKSGGPEARLYFSADDGTHDRELWNTDGTEKGTVRLTDTPAGAVPQNPVMLNDQLYVTLVDSEGNSDFTKGVRAGGSGCDAFGLPALGLFLLPLLGLLKR